MAWRWKKLNETINVLGDTIGAILGWLSAMKLDRLGKNMDGMNYI